MFWGFGCDIFGRRWAFNLTIGITAVFGLVAAGSPNFGAACAFAALMVCWCWWEFTGRLGYLSRVLAWVASVPVDDLVY